jgi:ubiquinol-cytochrome c reductase cytochrome b subunit
MDKCLIEVGTVITNLITIIPYFGTDLKLYIWGNYNIGTEALNRFYSLHYILPLLLLILILLHLYYVHKKGGTNKLGIKEELINFTRYYIYKDIMSFTLFILIFIFIILFKPSELGHVDNYIESNSLVTPTHIVPELYLLPYYTILRSIEEKRIGVLLLILSILIFILLPFIQSSILINYTFRPIYRKNLIYFILNYIYIGYMGTQIVIIPYIYINSFLSFYYFYYIISIIAISFFEYLIFLI